MVNRYRRIATIVAELNLGELHSPASRLTRFGPNRNPVHNCLYKCSKANTNNGVPNGIRTRVTALKGPCPGPG
jgi:hypothetical protein